MDEVDFKHKIDAIKLAIDKDLDILSRDLLNQANSYHPLIRQAMESYVEILQRGGKRLRGVLCVLGYEMYGGNDHALVIRAASILELVHAYLLVVDDVADRSISRRSGDTAHVKIKKEHEAKKYHGDSRHFGETIAINAGLVACNQAIGELIKLPSEPAKILDCVQLLCETLVVTGYGQILDVYNEATLTKNLSDIDQVLELKTAHYTILNPLKFGAKLAGANVIEAESFKEFSIHTGKLFQIIDDVLGVFGTIEELGKDPRDDMREGKQTLITLFALENAEKESALYIENNLGNQNLTQEEFEKCRAIFLACGAYDYAIEQAKLASINAKKSLKSIVGATNEGKLWLENIVDQLIVRKS